MNSDNLKKLVAKAPFGYAFHKIIVDDSGTPIDYEFIDVNPAFERLTGLKSCNILNKTVLQVIPDITKDSFDWITFYGEIAINGEEKEFEQYSLTLDRWYKVQAYAPEKYYFITVFSDITDRKRTEDVLNENVGNYSDIFHTISEGIAHTTLTGNVISINNALEKILDIPREKIVGRNILSLAKNLLSAKNFKVAAPFLKGIIQGKGVSGMHLEYKNKVLELNASINKETSRLTGVVRDITERKQFEESLFQTRLFLNSIIDQSPNSMWISDEHGNAVRVNQACRNLFALKDEEVVGKYNIFKDNIVQEQGFMPMVKDVFENGTTARFTIYYDTSAVEILELGRTTQTFLEVHISPILNSQGKVTNAIIQHVDITEQKQIEEKLRESKQIIESIINTIPAGVFWKDINLNYLGCNLVTANHAGFSDPKEVIGKDDFQMGWRNRAELYRIDDLQVIDGESAKVNIEEELTNATGETVTIITTKIPLKNAIGEVTGVLGTYVDITERKRVEEKNLKSEARYRNIINILPVPMALNDEEHNITLLNPAFVQTFGYSIEDLPTLSTWWPKAYPDADYRQWVTDNWQSELQKSKQTGATFKPMELTVKCKNGTDKTVLATASSIFDAYEGEHLVILYDITDRKKAEDKLREKDIQFRKLSANVTDLIFQFTRRPDGTYYVPIASEGIRNIFGCSPEDVLDDFTPIGRVIYPDDAARVISDIEYSAEHLTYFTCEFRVQIPGKEIQWIFSRSTPEKLPDGSITWYGFNADITKRKQAEEEIRHLNERIATATRSAQVGIWDWDVANNLLVWDDQMYALYGLKKDEFTRAYEAWVSGLHPEDREFGEDETRLALQGVKTYDSEFRVVWPDGSIRYLKAKGEVFHDEEKKPIRMLGVNFDITDRKQAEDKIKKLNEELEQRVIERTSQLEAVNKELETFTYSVSHDLKAPLRGIDGYSKLLHDLYAGVLPDEARNFVSTIRSSTRQMNQLIEDLLEYSRLERSQFRSEKIKISELIASITLIYKNELETGNFMLKTNIPDIEMVADEKGLTIALRNLIENALKFSAGAAHPAIDIEVEENKTSWIIRVADNGIGFDMKYSERIFEIFQRLQRPEDYPGTGIGLAMVSKAMQRMQGKAWATSKPGHGSSFYLEILKTHKYADYIPE